MNDYLYDLVRSIHYLFEPGICSLERYRTLCAFPFFYPRWSDQDQQGRQVRIKKVEGKKDANGNDPFVGLGRRGAFFGSDGASLKSLFA